MPAREKVTEEQVKRIRRRVKRRERLIDLAAEYGVNRKTLWRRIKAAELADFERARQTAERRAGVKRRQRFDRAYRNPARAPEHGSPERRDPAQPSEPRSRKSSGGRIGSGGVRLFPDTLKGNTARFAYYDARKLNNLPYSLWDYNTVRRGYATADELKAREARARRSGSSARD